MPRRRIMQSNFHVDTPTTWSYRPKSVPSDLFIYLSVHLPIHLDCPSIHQRPASAHEALCVFRDDDVLDGQAQ